jgi:hypothetical protein
MSIRIETYLPIIIVVVNLDLIDLAVGMNGKRLSEDLSTLA